MIVQPSAEVVTDQLARLIAARRSYVLECNARGISKAWDGPRFKRFVRREMKLCRSIRALVPVPDLPSPWGPLPPKENRAIWIGDVLWVLVEEDEEMGLEAGCYPVTPSAIRRLDDLPTA